ncbi:MAG: radical SAM protein [Synergistaceae bacterium]|nr:radical SAM protein [Synergistaceae bacterium]
MTEVLKPWSGTVLTNNVRSKTILGINPPVHDFAWFDLWSKPLGLLYILEFLRSMDNDVYLIDSLYEARTEALSFGRWKVKKEKICKPEVYRNIPRHYYRFGLSPQELEARLAELPKPDYILVTSAMTYWYGGVFETIESAGKVFPEAKIILGGAYAMLCPEHASKSGADYIQTEPFDKFFPAHPAIDMYEKPGYGVVMTSYGCPMSCQYCASKKLFPDFRQRPVEDVIEDIRFQLSVLSTNTTWHNIAFYDDALLLNKSDRFYPLCEAIMREFPRLTLHTPNGLHVSQIDEECAEMLFRTGFHTLRLSLEGVDDYTEYLSDDKTGKSGYEHTMKALKNAGYSDERLETYILVGLPGQNTDDILRSIDYVKSLGGKPKITEFSPIPGTKMFELALKYFPELAYEPLLHNNTIYAPWVSCSIPPKMMQYFKDRANY